MTYPRRYGHILLTAAGKKLEICIVLPEDEGDS